MTKNGSEVYKGDFQNHRYHGKGIFLSTNNFLLEGFFENNIVVGLTKVDWWLKKADMYCEWYNGLPSGSGYFKTKDLSYYFDGEWKNGLPIKEQVGVAIWASLNRSELEESASKDKKKDKKPPAGKDKKNKAITLESVATIPRGESVGNINIRSSFYEVPIHPSEVVPSKKDKDKAPHDDGKLKEPNLFQIINEKRRRVKIQLVSATVEEDVIHYGEPMDMWTKRQTMEDAATNWCRFAPLSLVMMCDSSSTLTWQQAVKTIYSIHKDKVQLNEPKLISLIDSTEHPLQRIVDSRGISCHPLDLSFCMSTKIDYSGMDQADDFLSFVFDFSINWEVISQKYLADRKANIVSSKLKTVDISLFSLIKTSNQRLELFCK